MLIIKRKIGQRIVIDGGIVLTVLSTQGSQLRLGFEGPANVRVRREEITLRPAGEPRRHEDAKEEG